MPDVPVRLPRPAWVDLSVRAELTVARRRVLELVETATGPMTAAEIASGLDLHHNTVREHLDALVEAGFVEVSSRQTGKRGRPALRYSATAPDPAQVLDSYLTLLDAVSDVLGDGPQAHDQALTIGRRWAQLTPRAQQAEDLQGDADTSERVARLLPDLRLMGFAPTVEDNTIILKACPLVTRNRVPHPLVCAMHEGYLNAVYERRDPPVEGRTRLALTPLVDDGCRIIVELQDDAPSESGSPG